VPNRASPGRDTYVAGVSTEASCAEPRARSNYLSVTVGRPTFDLTGSNKGSITPVTVSRDHRGSRLKPANSPLQPRYCFVLVPSFLRCEELNVFRSSQYSRDLTPNEIAVLQLMMAGYKFSTIATLLGCRHHTVRGRAWRIYNKLGADNRVQAVLFATDLGILDPLAFYGS